MAADVTRTDTFMRDLGVECYRVGGSVRDELLGRKVKDCDYVVRGVELDVLGHWLTDALPRKKGRVPERQGKVLPLVLRDGQQGGFRVIVHGEAIEIMLPRTEISTGPRHQDFKLVIDPNLPLEIDAQRRDFTFNALYTPILVTQTTRVKIIDELEIIDPLGCGVEDLRRRRINVTHPDSFRDDPLRILRALRFISTLGYELAPETRALMYLHADAATGLTSAGNASGTVREELEKLLMGDDPARALREARDCGVLAVAFPELAPMIGFDQASRYHDLTTDEHVFKTLETAVHVDAPLRVRLALLFHDSGKPVSAWVGKDGRKHYYGNPELGKLDHQETGALIWRKAAKRMGVMKHVREDVATLIGNHMVKCDKVDPVKVRRERVRLGDRLYHDLLLLRACDLTGKGKPNAEHMGNVAAMERVRAEAEAAAVPLSLKDLAITGADITTSNPRNIGITLKRILDEVVVDPSEQKLTREWQLGAIRRVLRQR